MRPTGRYFGRRSSGWTCEGPACPHLHYRIPGFNLASPGHHRLGLVNRLFAFQNGQHQQADTQGEPFDFAQFV
jgi:hypothetical protein